ncbi:hypothetical protein G6F65_017022 [Rhizopus arrhizus]|nr:hypothetical protein G6F65_017022 [Rhizopus arrhizus]
MADALEVVHQHALLGDDLLVFVQMLQHAAGAGAEVRAFGGDTLRRGLQHLYRARLVEMAAAGGLFRHHHLARQGAADEGDLAALAFTAGDTATIMAEVEDFGLERGTVDAGAGSGHVATGCGQKWGRIVADPDRQGPHPLAPVAVVLDDWTS